MCLWLLAVWNCGFESRRGYGCLSLVKVVCCQAEVTASGWSLVQRRPTECGVSECDYESSTMRGLGAPGLLRRVKKIILKINYSFASHMTIFSCVHFNFFLWDRKIFMNGEQRRIGKGEVFCDTEEKYNILNHYRRSHFWETNPEPLEGKHKC
jgi:hypothetical protein